MDINLDLRLEGQLDLRIQGYIGLDGGGSRRSPIEHSGRHLRALPAAEGDSGAADGERQRPVSRAVRRTRQAIMAVKEAAKSDDAQRVRQATDRLKEEAMGLRDAVQSRVAAADAERPSDAPDVVDAEFEETERSDRKAG
jgi:hypothetical protein